MKLVKPSYTIESEIDGKKILKNLEKCARTCYKSEDKITDTSAERLIRGIIKSGHESVIEHESIRVRFVVDRGVTHEMVRHRICSFSQESTRYCNYGGGVEFIIPCWMDIKPGEYKTHTTLEPAESIWFTCCLNLESSYQELLRIGWTPQQARSVLPNSLKTEIVVTANLREWRKIFQLRTSKRAHPQIREVMVPLLKELQEKIPVIFEDIICD